MSVGKHVEYLIRIHGAEKVQEEIRKVNAKMGQTGDTAAAASKQTAGFGAGLKSAAGYAKMFLGSFATLGGIIALFKAFYNHIVRVRDMLASLADKATQSQSAMLALATQLKVSPKEAQSQAAKTAMATGAPMDLAAEAIRGTHSASGQEAIDAGVHKAIAATMARTGGDVEQTGQAAEFLSRLGVKTEAEALDVFAKALAGMGSTTFNTLGEVIGAMSRGGIGAMIEDMATKGQMPSVEELMGFAAQARGATANPEQATRLMEQISVLMKKEELQDIVTKQSGKDFWEMGFTERIDAAGQALQSLSPKDRDKLLGDLRGPERARLINFSTFAPALEARKNAMAATRQASGATAAAANKEFQESAPGQGAMRLGREQNWQSQLTDFEITKGQSRTAAKARLEHERALDRVGFWANKLQLEEGQIRANDYANQLERMGLVPDVTPGSWGSTEILGRQLMKARGEELPERKAVASRFPDYSPRPIPDPSRVVREGGTIIHAQNVILPRQDITVAPANTTGGAP